jgi:hypothetical protein
MQVDLQHLQLDVIQLAGGPPRNQLFQGGAVRAEAGRIAVKNWSLDQ